MTNLQEHSEYFNPDFRFPGEEFRGIAPVESRYLISNFGRAFSIKRNLILKQVFVTSGYLTVGLMIKAKRVSSLVSRLEAIAFIPNPENKSDVNHINGIKTDNRLPNLEWNTRSENIVHAFKMELSNRNGKPVVGKPINGGENIYFGSCTAAAKFMGISGSYLTYYARNKKVINGYAWAFIDMENKIFTQKIINTESNYFGHWLALSKKPNGVTIHKAIGKTEHIAISKFLELS